MIDCSGYMSLRYVVGGRARPEVDCWGLYRLVVGEVAGIWLAEFEGTGSRGYAAEVARQQAADRETWLPVEFGDERPLDAVLIRGLVQTERGRPIWLPIHIGCVVDKGCMLDAMEKHGVRRRSFREGAVANHVIGIFRPRALA